MSHQTNNNTTSRKPTEDRVHGFSVVFSLRRPEKQHKYKAKNELKAHTIRQRIMLSSLNKRRIFFVENNNLHSLPPHCTGVLVAYSPCGKRITTEKDITDHHQWFLGTIIFHSYDITSIAPTEVRDEYYDKVSQSWNGANNIEYKILTERAVLLRRHEFKLRYINVVEVEQIPGQHYIEASLHGPDTVPRTVEMKKTMQELRSSNKCFLPEGSLSIPSRYVGKSPLLDILYCYKGGKPNITSRNNVKRRSIAAVGTHIVEIEGPITKLREGVDKSCLLVPLHQSKDIDSVSDSDVQQYVYLPKETYTSLCSGLEQRPDDMNKKLFMSSEKVVNLRKYDLDNYPNGLIFLYRPNDKLSEQTIVKEWDTPTAMEHWQLNGTVMSHWISNPNIYTIQRDHVNVMESVFGQKGFSRSSVDSIGMNIYTGTKSSPRVIPSPVVPKEKVLISQLWNVRCDVTYSPIANKLFNLLTAQAGGVMAASNSLLDRFYGVVLNRLYPDISSNDMPSHRRYCSLSIFTAGSQKSRCDGFANTPHIDKKDVFEQNFQREARRLLDELQVMFSYEETVLEDLAYLERLSQFETGFCVPTTCGYSFVNQQTEPVSPTSTQNIADFAMIGLGVSVTIRPKCYHFFMASLFTHCTPVPVQIHSSGIMSLYSGSYNLVGWGGGKAANDNTYTQRRYNLRSRSRRRRQQKRRRQN